MEAGSGFAIAGNAIGDVVEADDGERDPSGGVDLRRWIAMRCEDVDEDAASVDDRLWVGIRD